MQDTLVPLGNDNNRDFDDITLLGGFHLLYITWLGDEVSEGGSKNENGWEMGVVTLVDRGWTSEDVTVRVSKLYVDPFARYCG